MKKRLFSLLLVLALILAALPLTALAAGTLDNFTEKRSYPAGKFADVTTDKWFFDNVKRGYELGLIDGRTEDSFGPDLNITIAETIKLSACLHSIYYNGSANFVQGSPWYQVYVDYAVDNGIMPEYMRDASEHADSYITRRGVVMFFSWALPLEVFPVINCIEDDAIPDVYTDYYYYDDPIYIFYRAGILTGKDASGTFDPEGYILRSEITTILTRIVDVSLRQTFSLYSTRKIYASRYYIQLNAGESEEIILTINNDYFAVIGFASYDYNVAQPDWGNWLSDDSIALTIHAISPGYTFIELSLFDEYDEYYEWAYGTIFISVSVS